MKKLHYAANVYPDTPDSVLIQQSLTGDRTAYEYLVERYRPLLVSYISQQCTDEYMMLDVLQQVWIQLYVSLPTLHPDSLTSWLIREARHRCEDERRRRQPLLFSQFEAALCEDDVPPLAALHDSDQPPEEGAGQHEVQFQILQAILALPVKQRAIVWLRYAHQFSYAEIGRQLNIPAATAKTTFARAKPVVRQLLTDYAYSNPIVRETSSHQLSLRGQRSSSSVQDRR